MSISRRRSVPLEAMPRGHPPRAGPAVVVPQQLAVAAVMKQQAAHIPAEWLL